MLTDADPSYAPRTPARRASAARGPAAPRTRLTRFVALHATAFAGLALAAPSTGWGVLPGTALVWLGAGATGLALAAFVPQVAAVAPQAGRASAACRERPRPVGAACADAPAEEVGRRRPLPQTIDAWRRDAGAETMRRLPCTAAAMQPARGPGRTRAPDRAVCADGARKGFFCKVSDVSTVDKAARGMIVA
ncbi:MAG: hypothetical protein AAGB05_02495 [Pseudomonadota bacterium]